MLYLFILYLCISIFDRRIITETDYMNESPSLADPDEGCRLPKGQLFLPPANEVAGRSCFHRCFSVQGKGWVSLVPCPFKGVSLVLGSFEMGWVCPGGGYVYIQGYHRIWLTSGRYASCWNAFLLYVFFHFLHFKVL